jgi:hypothetical protein
VESRYPIQPLPLDGVTTYPLADRKNKVTTEMFGKAFDGSRTFQVSFQSCLAFSLVKACGI